MILIDNRKGEYRFVLSCDGCCQGINDPSFANADFVPRPEGELQLRGVGAVGE